MTEPGRVREAFRQRYGHEPRLFRAPGRVNLLGEHTDYNDGLVLPMAIDRDTVVAAAARGDRRLRVHSINREEEAELDLDGPRRSRPGEWTSYVEGTARVLEEETGRLPGADLVLQGDVPEGSGLSSSASLEMAVGLALASLAGRVPPPRRLAAIGQSAEHRFVGTRCGLMDQTSSLQGRAGHALLMDCRSLELQPIPLHGRGLAVLVCDTGVRHRLAAGEYNRRRAECEEAVRTLAVSRPWVRSLRDLSPEDLGWAGERLKGPLFRRVRHVVGEIARTRAAASALWARDLEAFGRLMKESHCSLRDDYEVSVPELDALAEAAWSAGAYGARLTGGGFGGCVIAAVAPAAVEAVSGAMQRSFQDRFGHCPACFVASAAAGAGEIGA